MTTFYLDSIHEGRKSWIMQKVLCRWKGSLYKLVWVDMVFYLSIYYAINIIYKCVLKDHDKRKFETIVLYFCNNRASIPVSFLLGFFVSGVIARWYQMYLQIPWINRLVFLIEGSLNGGNHENQRKIRQTIYRYVNVSWTLCMRKISQQIKNRFCNPNTKPSELKSVRDILSKFNEDRKVQTTFRKLITDAEMRAFENIAVKSYASTEKKSMPDFSIPLQWSCRVLQNAFLHGYMSDSRTLMHLIDEVEGLRGNMQKLQIFCNITIPLVYTQVIIIAVYSYFFCEIIASQSLDPHQKLAGHENDLIFPFFSVIQFIFFTGWLKVALSVMNPFGDNDEDFQISDMLNYNLDLTHRCCSENMNFYPEILDTPVFNYNSHVCTSKDNFENFLESVEDDIDEIHTPKIEDDVTALELSYGTCHRNRSCLWWNCGSSVKKEDFYQTEILIEQVRSYSKRSLNERAVQETRNSLRDYLDNRH